jgi:hypothetical protein
MALPCTILISVRARSWFVAVLIGVTGVPAAAQDAGPGAGRSWFGDRIRIAGEAAASTSTSDAEREGWFNYADYETSMVRTVRLSLVGEVTLTSRVALLTEIRTFRFERPEAYALYVRIRPWLSQRFDLHLGRVPPTFGAFPRRLYVADNPLIGLPLGYQYLTSARSDALPSTSDELARWRGRGWSTTYEIGNTTPAAGLPLVNALRWDTGVQARWQGSTLTVFGALTQGSLADPRLDDDNGRPQVAGRVIYAPHPMIAIGASAARGAYLRRQLARSLPDGARITDYEQQALGADVEISRDRWIVRAEVLHNRWEQPAFGAVTSRELVATAAYVEARYRLRPGLYVAARGDRLDFSRISTGEARLVTWDAPVDRVEVGVGWSPFRHLLVKTVWQRNRRDGGRVRASDLGAVQVVTWF